MSTAVSIILILVALFLFSFWLWRSLAQDYPNEHIFSFQIWLFVGALVGLLLANFSGKFLFWAMLAAASIFGFVDARRKKISLFDAFDSICPPFFLFYILVLLSQAARAWPELPVGILIETVPPVLALFASLVFARYYRRFWWYPSGRVGFVGLSSFAIFFSIRSLLAIFAPNMLFFASGLIDVLAGSGISLAFGTILYIRSGRKFREDLAQIVGRLKIRKREFYGG